MTKPAFSQILLTLVAALVLACIPIPASAQHHGSSHSGGFAQRGSSHGGSSRGGSSFHSGGHASGGSGHSFGNSRAKAPKLTARASGGFTDRGHSTFSGSGHSFGSSQARAPKLTARMSGGFTNGGRASSGRSGDRSYAGNSGFSSRSSDNFAGSKRAQFKLGTRKLRLGNALP